MGFLVRRGKGPRRSTCSEQEETFAGEGRRAQPGVSLSRASRISWSKGKRSASVPSATTTLQHSALQQPTVTRFATATLAERVDVVVLKERARRTANARRRHVAALGSIAVVDLALVRTTWPSVLATPGASGAIGLAPLLVLELANQRVEGTFDDDLELPAHVAHQVLGVLELGLQLRCH